MIVQSLGINLLLIKNKETLNTLHKFACFVKMQPFFIVIELGSNNDISDIKNRIV